MTLHTSISYLKICFITIIKLYLSLIYYYYFSCSSADDDDNEDPSTKAHREKERRQANNVRER